MAVRVVLVDDAEEVRSLVRTALRLRGGFEVVGEAGDGQEAVELVSATKPDVLVLDLGLPDLAGREIVTRVRRISPGTRIVVFTGTQTPDRSWIRGEVEGFAVKEHDLDLLLDLVGALGVADEAEWRLTLPAEPQSVAEARHYTRAVLEDRGVDESVAPDAALLVSELATNAVTHARSEFELRLAFLERRLRIEVRDNGDGNPEPEPESLTTEHGRGLHLVSSIAAAWGVDPSPDGKVVWAELAF